MNIIEFLKSLSWELNMYEVVINWQWDHQCSVCGKYYKVEDDEYSREKSTVADYRTGEETHPVDYPDVYKTRISECEILIGHGKIVISHSEFGDKRVCEECEAEEDTTDC